MKNKIFCALISILILVTICVSPTFGKYVYSNIGVAGFLSFTPLIPTGVFVVEDKNFIENGVELDEIMSESKWGADGKDLDNPEKEYGLNTLNELQFSINNKSSKKLKVSFYIELLYEGRGFLDWALALKGTKFSFSIINITKENATVSLPYAKYFENDSQEKIEGTNNYIFKKTLSPIDNTPTSYENNTSYKLEELFIIEPSKYADYNVLINIDQSDFGASLGELLSSNYYYNFHLVVTEYTPA